MAKAKKIIGIILLSIGLFIIILFSMFSIVYKYIYILPIISGVFLFVIGYVFLMASRKKISAANEKKIAGIILLSIGLIIIISSVIFMFRLGSYWRLLVVPLILGVVHFVIGLVLLLTSRKKNSKFLDDSITK